MWTIHESVRILALRRHARMSLASLAVGIAAVLLVSCGSSEETDDTPEPASSQGTEAAAADDQGTVQEPLLPEGTVSVQGISVYAGTGGPGFGGDGGVAAAAEMYAPTGLALDGDGNLYVSTDNRIRKIDARTGIITTIAGAGGTGYAGDGKAAIEAKFKAVEGLAIDSAGNIYAADRSNGRIRKIDAATGIITTVAGGGIPKRVGGVLDPGDGAAATDAWFKEPTDVALDGQGNFYFLADNKVRMVDTAGIISTVGGTGKKGSEGDGGPALEATMADPTGIAVDPEAKFVYIADTANHRVRRIDLGTGIMTTIAGKGTVSLGTTLDPLEAAAGAREGGGGAGFSGDGGPATDALLAQPIGLVIGQDGNLYIADHGNDRIRKIDLATGIITSVVDGGAILGEKMEAGFIGSGDLKIEFTHFAPPRDIVIGPTGDIYITDVEQNKIVRYAP